MLPIFIVQIVSKWTSNKQKKQHPNTRQQYISYGIECIIGSFSRTHLYIAETKRFFFPRVIFCNVMCNVVQKNVLNSKFLKSLDCSGRSKGTTNVL